LDRSRAVVLFGTDQQICAKALQSREALTGVYQAVGGSYSVAHLPQLFGGEVFCLYASDSKRKEVLMLL
jgi:hypothetical protein